MATTRTRGSDKPTLPTADEVRNVTAAEAAAMVKPADTDAPETDLATAASEAAEKILAPKPAEDDGWGDLETEAVSTIGPKLLDIPKPIRDIVDVAFREQAPRIVVIDGWSDKRVKDFTKFARAAGAYHDASVRVVPTMNKGRKVLGVSAKVRQPRTKKTTDVPSIAANANAES